jgi:hypothetical protein
MNRPYDDQTYQQQGNILTEAFTLSLLEVAGAEST